MSLWAPVIAFVAGFSIYLVLIAWAPGSVVWARPALLGLGALAVLAWIGLGFTRWVAPAWWARRDLRDTARDLLAESERRPQGAGVDEAARELRAALEQGGSLELPIEALRALGEQKPAPAWAGALGFVQALLVALLLRAAVIEPYRIPSGSMLPTLQVGDQVFIDKFVYGVRLPFLNVVPFPIFRRPARGDVIVFENPLDSSRDFIKRVVGIPGDTVELDDEVVVINGIVQPRQLLRASETIFTQMEISRRPHDWLAFDASVYEETIAGRRHEVLQSPAHPRGAMHQGPYRVPDGAVFVLGDNRDNSADSRVGFGLSNQPAFVPYGHIKGQARVIWLSLSHGGWLSSLFGGTGLRTDRLFLPVQ